MAILSIIVPVYNVENHLKSCVDSILNQSFKDFELFLVDDGSTDYSGTICDQYALLDDRIKSFHIKNGGPGKARNIGLDNATGEYVQFIDSDDSLCPNALQAMYDFSRNKNAEIFIANSMILNTDDDVIGSIKSDLDGAFAASDVLRNLSIDRKAILLHYLWNKWYKREAISNLRFNENLRLGEDFVFNCKILKSQSQVCFADFNFYNYYKRKNDSLTQKFNSNELSRRRMMDESFINLYYELGLYNQCERDIKAFLGAITMVSIGTVFAKNAPKKFKRKKEFICGFLNSEYITYLKAYKSSKIHKSLKVNFDLVLLCSKLVRPYVFYKKCVMKVKAKY